MKTRIRQIQDREGMYQKDFAAAIGISAASLSSIYNGRTKPTSRLVDAIHKRFPDINVIWLMYGEGNMLESENAAAGSSDRPASAETLNSDSVRNDVLPNQLVGQESPVSSVNPSSGVAENIQPIYREVVKFVDKPPRRVREIQVIYEDGILETFVLKTDK